jgi:hypothetical protein
LDLGRAGVTFRTPVLRDDLGSLGLGERHTRQGYQTTRTPPPRLPWSEAGTSGQPARLTTES